MKDSHYPYHPQPIAICFAALVVLGATIFMGNAARTNDRGLVLEGFLHFDTDGATAFCWLMSSIFFGGLLFLLRCCFVTIFRSPTLELTDTYVSAPPNAASTKNVVVKFSKVRRMQLFEHRRRQYIDIEFVPDQECDADKLRIRERFLANRATFQLICNTVGSNVSQSRTRSGSLPDKVTAGNRIGG